jgi:NAD(P)-dependent dehydrogenase (short-subunit alcohol dehydrogenase family)
VSDVISEHNSNSNFPNGYGIVTGGSRGLGFATAAGLIKAGISVVIIGKDVERLKTAKQKLSEQAISAGSYNNSNKLNDTNSINNQSVKKVSVESRAVDVADTIKFREVLKEITSTFGVPKILMLAHGVMSEKMSKTLRTNDEEWRRVLAINLDAVFVALNQVVPAMADARDGRVVVYSACLGRMSGPGNAGGLAPYRISKAGVNALVRNLAHETGMGARGLLVDAICPNHSRTDMGGPDAPRSAEEGAQTAIWLATRNFEPGKDQTGLLWEDQQVVPW